LKENSLWSYFS